MTDPQAEYRTATRDDANPGLHEVIGLIERATAEIRSAPRKQRLAVIRQVMARGFVEPSPAADGSAYRFQDAQVGKVRGEWVLSPHADPHRRLLYLHGGGFVSGCPYGFRVISTQLARVTAASVLALDYRLMPEHSRRDMIDDCQQAYRWILEHGPAGPTPIRQLFVAGDSAGGNLTLMLIAWARDQGLRAADGVMAFSPSVDMTLASPSLKRNLASDLMLGPGLRRFLKIPRVLFLPMIAIWNRMRPSNPLISPLFGDLAGLPPTLVQASEAEMLLDEARRYVDKARAAGSLAQLETWPDMPHVWQLFEPILPEAREAFEQVGRFVASCSPATKTESMPKETKR